MKKLMAIFSVLLLLAGSAVASEWDFYGSARVQTWGTDSDLNDTKDFDLGLQANSRIGARVNVSDDLTGRFEYGVSDGDVSLRLLYGTWNFGAGNLTIGQDYTPLYMPVSNQAYNGDSSLAGWGEPYPGREAQIKLAYGGFQVALVEPTSTYWNGAALVDTSTEKQMPSVEVAYKASLNNWSFGVGAGYNTFEISNQYDVDSYIGVVSAKVTMSAFTLGAEAFMGENIGNMVSSNVNGTDSGKGYAQFDGTRVLDNESYGYEIVAGYKFNDMVSCEAGVGYQRSELEGQDEDDVIAYYVQAPITLAPGVFIVPEIGRVDYQDAGQDEVTYWGAKWQINF